MLVCVDRLKGSKGKIIQYAIQNTTTNEIIHVNSDILKEKLRNDEIAVLNLKLTLDDRVILLNNDFQKKVDKTNRKYKNDANVTKSLEEAVDKFMSSVYSFKYFSDIANVTKVLNVNTSGDENTITLAIRNSILEGEKNTKVLLRYRKNVIKKEDANYYVNVAVKIIGIGVGKDITALTNIKEYETEVMVYNSLTNKLDSNAEEYSILFTDYIVYNLDYLSRKVVDNEERRKRYARYTNIFKKKGIQCTACCLALLTYSSLLVGCGTSPVDNKSSVNNTEVSQQVDYRTYTCDYKTFSMKTKIVTELRGKVVVIEGNMFNILTDPLVMRDLEGNVLGEASDKYNIISNDDHSIIVDDKVELVMSGDVNIVGKSYSLYNKDGVHVGDFKRSLMGFSAEIVDTNGNLIASYSKSLIRDFEVRIYDNCPVSDEAVLLIVASFVSDDIVDSRSSSNN